MTGGRVTDEGRSPPWCRSHIDGTESGSRDTAHGGGKVGEPMGRHVDEMWGRGGDECHRR